MPAADRDAGFFDLHADPLEQHDLPGSEAMPEEQWLSLSLLRASLGALGPCRTR